MSIPQVGRTSLSSVSVVPPRWSLLALLVPKLCLGTHGHEALLRRTDNLAGDVGFCRFADSKQSFDASRSQAELGNEETRKCEILLSLLQRMAPPLMRSTWPVINAAAGDASQRAA